MIKQYGVPLNLLSSVLNYMHEVQSSICRTDRFFFKPINKVSNDWKKLLKETIWMHVLDTISPNGMNSKVYSSPKV